MLEMSNLAHQKVPCAVHSKLTERISGIFNLYELDGARESKPRAVTKMPQETTVFDYIVGVQLVGKQVG